MSVHVQQRGYYLVLLTLVVSLILNYMPLSEQASRLRPDILLIVLIYWAMALPHRVGMLTGFFAGLLMDGATGSLMGQHAFVYVISLWMISIYHKRLRVVSRWNQTLSVILLLLFGKLVEAIVLGVTHAVIPDLKFWASPFLTIFIWPWLFPFLRNFRQSFRIS